MKFIHFIWLILPFTFLVLAIWAYLKKLRGDEQIEDSGWYFHQFVFTFVTFIAALLLDVFFGDTLDENFSTEYLDFDIVRWLLYPAVLVVGAKVMDYFKKEEPEKKKR